MFKNINGTEFYQTAQGEYLPRYADAGSIREARELNYKTQDGQPIMGGSFRLKGWQDGLFRFAVNKSSAIYRDNGNGQYELQLGMTPPPNKGNGF